MLNLAVAQLHYPHAQLLLLAKIIETFHQFLFLEVKHVYVLTTNVLKFLVNMCHSCNMHYQRNNMDAAHVLLGKKMNRLLYQQILKTQTPCCYLKLFYKCNRLHFLGVFLCNKPTRDVRKPQEKLLIYKLSLCSPTIPCGFITLVNPA